ncbi:unnamed protein product [Symbiodinium microadriaticum]|nr:unnamed protein product [Symbiodinium microadriaticum]
MQYDQVAVPGYRSSGRHLPAADEEETADSQLRREVQKSLSAARKADLKDREERQLKEAQWAQFEKDSAAYLKEKNRFQTALDRIETDIQQTMEQGREASVMVQTLVARGPAALPAPSAETETDGSWEDLIKDEEPSVEAGFLREAMIAAKQVSRQPGGVALLLDGRMVTPAVAAQVLQAVMANLPVAATEPANPVGRVGAPHAPPIPPPAKGAPPMSGTAAPDVPYNSSPKATAPEAVNTGPAVASPNVHPRQKPTTRVPVKGTPVRPVHTGTGDVAKLTDKLQAKRNAMQPFGGHETRPEEHRLGTEQAIELEEMDEDMANMGCLQWRLLSQTSLLPVGIASELRGTVPPMVFCRDAYDLFETGDGQYDLIPSEPQILSGNSEVPLQEDQAVIATPGLVFRFMPRGSLMRGIIAAEPRIAETCRKELPLPLPSKAGPRRRDRERDPEPDPETALGTAPVIDDPDEEDIVTATFLVVAPRHKVILVDVDTVTSSADFKRIAISELQYTSEHALDAIHITPDSDTDTAEGSDDGPTTLHFVVLKPGFTPEHFRLQLQLPATLNEALRELQALRPPAEVRKFSSLIPANPQPCPGNGVVLALPAWCTGPDHPRVFLCLDTSLVDGRLYTCASPPYISRRHLLHLACLPLDSGVDVHIGDDPVPLDHEGQHQVINGDTFVFAPAGTIVPTLHSLALDLFNRQEWSPISTFPRVSSDGHYGLVHESESILYTTQFEQPTAFRERIAACVGVRIGNLKVSPSSPRIADAALDGYPCRTVIAICDSSAGAGLPLFGVLVDCRAILRGWQAFEVIAERVSCIRVLVVLQRIAPPGWRIYLEGVPADADWIAVRPGQVLIAALAPAMPLGFPEQVPEDSAQAPEAGSSHEGVGLAGEPDSGAPVPISSDPGSEQDDPEHSGQSDIHGSHPRVTGQGEHVACRFLLLGPGYIAELVEVRLPVGSPVATAVARVAAARAPQDVLRLPRVFAVDPQPHGSHALCVTAPEWDVHGAIVVFDSRGINGKLFAFQITCPIDRAGLLTVAQFETSDPVDVFIGSQPWPLVDGPLVSLVHGDLVLLRSAQAPAHTIVSLHDMLLAAAGWDSAFDPAQQIEGGFSGHTWLLGDERSELFIVRPERMHLAKDLPTQEGLYTPTVVHRTSPMPILPLCGTPFSYTLPILLANGGPPLSAVGLEVTENVLPFAVDMHSAQDLNGRGVFPPSAHTPCVCPRLLTSVPLFPVIKPVDPGVKGTPLSHFQGLLTHGMFSLSDKGFLRLATRASLPLLPVIRSLQQPRHAGMAILLDGRPGSTTAELSSQNLLPLSKPSLQVRLQSLGKLMRWLRKRAHRASGTLKLYDVHCAFQAWKTDGSFRYELQRHFSGVFNCVALQAATSSTKDVIQRLRPLLGPPRRKQRGTAPLPVVRLEDGTFAPTPQEADARWLRHFSAAEHGGPIEPDDLIQRCLNRQYGADLDAFDVDPHDLPTKCELEQAFRAAQPGRASGNDGMSPDILHLFPGEMAKIFYPVLLKVAFRLQEPLQFKGGSVSHIYKHKGDQAFRKHRRLIFASPIVTHREKDGKDTQLPAVSASGPLRQWSSVGYEPEPERVDFAAWLVPDAHDVTRLAAVKKAALVTSYHDGVEIVSNFQGPVLIALQLCFCLAPSTARQMSRFNTENYTSPMNQAAGDLEGLIDRTTEGIQAICAPAHWSAPTIDGSGTVYGLRLNGKLYAVHGPQETVDTKELKAALVLDSSTGVVAEVYPIGSASLHGAMAWAPGLYAFSTCDTLQVFHTK